jgi:hypothetical protein
MGTPFLESAKRSQASHRHTLEIVVSSLTVVAVVWAAWDFSEFSGLPLSWITWTIALIVTLGVAVLGWSLAFSYALGLSQSRYQPEFDRLLVMFSDSDEAYQLLSNVANSENPFLRVAKNEDPALQPYGKNSFWAALEWFIHISNLLRDADRLRFPDRGQAIPLALVVLFFTLVALNSYVPGVLREPLCGLALIAIGGFFVYGYFLRGPTIAVICIPFRIAHFVFDVLKSLALKLGVWVMRRNVWRFLRSFVLGLTDYPFRSYVSQTPTHSPVLFINPSPCLKAC